MRERCCSGLSNVLSEEGVKGGVLGGVDFDTTSFAFPFTVPFDTTLVGLHCSGNSHSDSNKSHTLSGIKLTSDK